MDTELNGIHLKSIHSHIWLDNFSLVELGGLLTKMIAFNPNSGNLPFV